jgi:hypothetical protein
MAKTPQIHHPELLPWGNANALPTPLALGTAPTQPPTPLWAAHLEDGDQCRAVAAPNFHQVQGRLRAQELRELKDQVATGFEESRCAVHAVELLPAVRGDRRGLLRGVRVLAASGVYIIL